MIIHNRYHQRPHEKLKIPQKYRSRPLWDLRALPDAVSGFNGTALRRERGGERMTGKEESSRRTEVEQLESDHHDVWDRRTNDYTIDCR